jgi:folate-dependent phosphoribosylglycinamide formyltransferase PurN
MKVVGFMSGSGTNLVKILEHQRVLQDTQGRAPYEVVLVFTDNPDSNAKAIAEKFGTAYGVNDIMEFYRSRGHTNKKDMSLRPEFDRESLKILDKYEIDAVALAGYMSVVTKPLLEAFDGRIINVHPANLAIIENGKRKYTGARGVALAIAAGEKELRSTMHIVREAVDYGEILMLSEPLPVTLPEGVTVEALNNPSNKSLLKEIADQHQSILKEIGDWKIFPATIENMALGRYTIKDKVAYLDGKSVV